MRLLWRGRRRSLDPGGATAVTAEVLRKVQSLEMRTRGLVESLLCGEYVSIFQGRGFEFSHLRRYEVGDDIRAIDWKVTARLGSPFIRQFVEERDLLVVLMVDVSGSGRFSPGERSSGEVATEIAAALAFAATRNNDRVALLLVSDRVEHFVAPGSGRKHVMRLLVDLVAHRSHRTGTDLTSGFEHIARSLSGRATVFVISDFIQSCREPAFRTALTRITRMHDLVAVRLAGVAMDELPNVGWVEMTDPESGRRVVIDTGSRGVREHYRRSVEHAQADIATLLTEVGAELVDVNIATDALAALAGFFRRRQRAKR
jgi:uncharacterized protein (DUF58 family)